MFEDVRRQPKGEQFMKLGPVKNRGSAEPSLGSSFSYRAQVLSCGCALPSRSLVRQTADFFISCTLQVCTFEAQNQVSSWCTCEVGILEQTDGGWLSGFSRPRIKLVPCSSHPAMLCLLKVAEN